MDFARTLKELRDSRDVTQEELAKYLNVSRPTVAGYETKQRQPDFEKLIMIAQYFQVSVDYLLTGKENSPISLNPAPLANTKVIDKKVMNSYKKLDSEDRQEVLKYIHLLRRNEKYEDGE